MQRHDVDRNPHALGRRDRGIERAGGVVPIVNQQNPVHRVGRHRRQRQLDRRRGVGAVAALADADGVELQFLARHRVDAGLLLETDDADAIVRLLSFVLGRDAEKIVDRILHRFFRDNPFFSTSVGRAAHVAKHPHFKVLVHVHEYSLPAKNQNEHKHDDASRIDNRHPFPRPARRSVERTHPRGRRRERAERAANSSRAAITHHAMYSKRIRGDELKARRCRAARRSSLMSPPDIPCSLYLVPRREVEEKGERFEVAKFTTDANGFKRQETHFDEWPITILFLRRVLKQAEIGNARPVLVDVARENQQSLAVSTIVIHALKLKYLQPIVSRIDGDYPAMLVDRNAPGIGELARIAPG